MCSVYRLDEAAVPQGSQVKAAARKRGRAVVRISETAPVALADGGLLPMRWGFRRAFNSAIHNARCERLDAGMWADALRHRRCLVPMTAYHEWFAAPDGRKLAHQIGRDAHPLLWAAGLWEESPQDGPCFTMVTRPVAAAIAWLHDRMPLLLDDLQRQRFLDAAEIPNNATDPPDLVAAPCESPLRAKARDRENGPQQGEFDF